MFKIMLTGNEHKQLDVATALNVSSTSCCGPIFVSLLISCTTGRLNLTKYFCEFELLNYFIILLFFQPYISIPTCEWRSLLNSTICLHLPIFTINLQINTILISVFLLPLAEKLLTSEGRDLRRALFSLKQIFQEDKDLVHGFVGLGGLNCLVRVGNDADQNYQNYILRALGQVC